MALLEHHGLLGAEGTCVRRLIAFRDTGQRTAPFALAGGTRSTFGFPGVALILLVWVEIRVLAVFF